MPGARASLSDLPDELVVAIVEVAVESERRLFWHRCSETVVNLSLTNRRLHRLVLPLLYERFAFNLTTQEQFLRTFGCKPQLGRFIKQIRWNYNIGRDGTRRDSLSGRKSSLLERGFLASTVRTLGASIPLDISTLLDRMSERDERCLAAFLMFTPNIESLDVVDKFEFDGHRYWLDIIRLASPYSFQRLRSVRIRTGEMRLNNVLPLFLLPSMKKLELSELAELEPSNDPHGFSDLGNLYDLPSGVSNITHFHLRYCLIDSKVTKRLLRLFHSLCSFEHDFNHHEYLYPVNLSVPNDSKLYILLDYTEIAQGLHVHAGTLQHLRLYDTEEWFGAAKIDLRNFTALKTMHARFACLLDRPHTSWPTPDPPITPQSWNVLPPNVSEIVFFLHFWDIHEVCKHVEESFMCLARCAKPILGMLRKVRTAGPSRLWNDSDIPDWDMVKKLFGNAGIDFELDKEPLDDSTPTYSQKVPRSLDWVSWEK